MSSRDLGARARELALEAGFDLVGIASARAPAELAFFAEWVGRGHAGEMGYLTRQVAKRSDLRTAFPWARSIVCVGLQYDTPHAYSTDAPDDRGWISRYAWGDDYHDVMKAMLDRMVERLREEAGLLSQNAAVTERLFAAYRGLRVPEGELGELPDGLDAAELERLKALGYVE